MKFTRFYISLFALLLLLPVTALAQHISAETFDCTYAFDYGEVETGGVGSHVFSISVILGPVEYLGTSLEGNSAFAITNISLPNNDPPGFLEEGDTAEVEVMYTPESTGEHTAFLEISTDASNEDCGLIYGDLDYTLKGTGILGPQPGITVSCGGFYHPMDIPVTVRNNRAVLPLRAHLEHEGSIVTFDDLSMPPVVQIMFDPEDPDDDPIVYSDDVLSAGDRTDGNQFFYIPESQQWHFNLWARPYTAKGTYTITMESGDIEDYQFDPKCEAWFVRK